jgi:hypothetical protein
MFLVELKELVVEFATGWNMHHIVHKQSVDAKVSTFVFHEKMVCSLFTAWVIMLPH